MEEKRQGKMIQNFESTSYSLKFTRNDKEYQFRSSSPSTHFRWIEEQCKTEEDFQRYINSPFVNFKPMELSQESFSFLTRKGNNYFKENHDFKIDDTHLYLTTCDEYGVDYYECDETEYPEEMYENPYKDFPYIEKTDKEEGYILFQEDKEKEEYTKVYSTGSCEGLNYLRLEHKRLIIENSDFYIKIEGNIYLKYFNDKNEKILIIVSQSFLDFNLQYLNLEFAEKIKNEWH